ncbi:MAG: type II toxin-antitoxin system Phd/YefM family antitoxin [Anaerolineales bacterium]|nr:type II toxin-antitoxin system Phd/YefM family antitoxin [Anaerolineales bacterium]
MNVYTYSEARQNLASLLDQAAREGEVRIRRKDGQIFLIRVQPKEKSPLEVKGMNLGLSTQEILGFIDEGRKSYK